MIHPIKEFSNSIIFIDHTKRGKSRLLNELSDNIQRIMTCDNRHLAHDMRFTDENHFPILSAYNPDSLDFDLFSYKDRNKHKEGRWAIHFFQNDYTFFKAVTERLEVTTSTLINCDVLFAPDFSLYVDGPVFMNMQNVFRSRFAAAYWQLLGLNVIQTASWGDANSFRYCFEGLAEHSVTAVCGIGHDYCLKAKLLWQYAVQRLIEEKSPTKLIVYGGEKKKLPDLGIPVFYFEDYITKNFRYGS